MGYLVNPIIYRVGYSKTWQDAWYIHRINYPVFLHKVLLLKLAIFFLFFRYFHYRKLNWVYSHINLYTFNNNMYINLYLYDARDLSFLKGIIKRFKYTPWYRIMDSQFFKKVTMDRKEKVKRFFRFLPYINAIFYKAKMEEWEYLYWPPHARLYWVMSKKFIDPYIKYDLFQKHWLNKSRDFKKPLPEYFIKGQKLFILLNRNRIFMFKNARDWKKRKYFLPFWQIKEEIQEFEHNVTQRMRISKSFGSNYFLLLQRHFIKLIKYKLYRDNPHFGVKGFIVPNAYWYKFKQDKERHKDFKYRMSFLLLWQKKFLNFIQVYDNIVRYKNPNYPHDNLSRRMFRKVILFYIFYFFFKPILKLYENLISLIAFYLGLNVKVNVFVLKNKNLPAEFIARFIAISIKMRTKFFDIMKPIKRNLKKLLYKNQHIVQEELMENKNFKIMKHTMEKSEILSIWSILYIFVKSKKFEYKYFHLVDNLKFLNKNILDFNVNINIKNKKFFWFLKKLNYLNRDFLEKFKSNSIKFDNKLSKLMKIPYLKLEANIFNEKLIKYMFNKMINRYHIRRRIFKYLIHVKLAFKYRIKEFKNQYLYRIKRKVKYINKTIYNTEKTWSLVRKKKFNFGKTRFLFLKNRLLKYRRNLLILRNKWKAIRKKSKEFFPKFFYYIPIYYSTDSNDIEFSINNFEFKKFIKVIGSGKAAKKIQVIKALPKIKKKIKKNIRMSWIDEATFQPNMILSLKRLCHSFLLPRKLKKKKFLQSIFLLKWIWIKKTIKEIKFKNEIFWILKILFNFFHLDKRLINFMRKVIKKFYHKKIKRLLTLKYLHWAKIRLWCKFSSFLLKFYKQTVLLDSSFLKNITLNNNFFKPWENKNLLISFFFIKAKEFLKIYPKKPKFWWKKEPIKIVELDTIKLLDYNYIYKNTKKVDKKKIERDFLLSKKIVSNFDKFYKKSIQYYEKKHKHNAFFVFQFEYFVMCFIKIMYKFERKKHKKIIPWKSLENYEDLLDFYLYFNQQGIKINKFWRWFKDWRRRYKKPWVKINLEKLWKGMKYFDKNKFKMLSNSFNYLIKKSIKHIKKKYKKNIFLISNIFSQVIIRKKSLLYAFKEQFVYNNDFNINNHFINIHKFFKLNVIEWSFLHDNFWRLSNIKNKIYFFFKAENFFYDLNIVSFNSFLLKKNSDNLLSGNINDYNNTSFDIFFQNWLGGLEVSQWRWYNIDLYWWAKILIHDFKQIKSFLIDLFLFDLKKNIKQKKDKILRKTYFFKYFYLDIDLLKKFSFLDFIVNFYFVFKANAPLLRAKKAFCDSLRKNNSIFNRFYKKIKNEFFIVSFGNFKFLSKNNKRNFKLFFKSILNKLNKLKAYKHFRGKLKIKKLSFLNHINTKRILNKMMNKDLFLTFDQIVIFLFLYFYHHNVLNLYVKCKYKHKNFRHSLLFKITKEYINSKLNKLKTYNWNWKKNMRLNKKALFFKNLFKRNIKQFILKSHDLNNKVIATNRDSIKIHLYFSYFSIHHNMDFFIKHFIYNLQTYKHYLLVIYKIKRKAFSQRLKKLIKLRYNEENLSTDLFFKNETIDIFFSKNSYLHGYKFRFAGRFTRKQRAANIWFQKGYLSHATMDAFVDYAAYSVTLRYSRCTIKVWLYKSDHLPIYQYTV